MYIVVDGWSSSYSGPFVLSAELPICGDGGVQSGETCDDGNVAAGDGCGAACATEPGFVCDAPGQPCRPIVCGDGLADAPFESCDDGNASEGDGCDATCTLEVAAPGGSIVVAGSLDATDPTWVRPNASCGGPDRDSYVDHFAVANRTGVAQRLTVTGTWAADGYLHVFQDPFDPAVPTQGCVAGNDDFNGTSQSQVAGVVIRPGERLVVVVSAYGTLDPIGPWTVEVATDVPVCGDGVAAGGEACDDGNAAAGDGCAADCSATEPGFVCDVEGSACTPLPPRVVINEVDYDQTDTDGAEFVELYNGTGADVSLATLSLVLVNGNNGAEYARVDLAAAGATLPAGGYLIVGPANYAVPAGALFAAFSGPNTDRVQNGAPDAMALVDTATQTVLDALSYEGSVTAATIAGFPGTFDLVEGTATAAVDDPGTAQAPIAGSLCRRGPNARDTDDASLDWSFCTTLSPGAANP